MATPVFSCGFECGVTGHVNLSGSSSFDTGTVRSGFRSLRLNPSGTTATAQRNDISAATSSWVVRFYVRFATMPTTNGPMFGLYNGGASHMGIYFTANTSTDAFVRLQTNNTPAGTNTAVTVNKWYLMEFKSDYNSGASQKRIEGYIQNVTDNLPQVSLGSLAQSLAETLSTGLLMGLDAINTADLFFDDVVASNTISDYPLGPGKIEPYVPTSDGAHNVAGAADFRVGTAGADITNATTTAWQLIDDVPMQSGAPGTTDFINLLSPPNATDYVECVFGPASGITATKIVPRAVEVIAGYAQAGTGAGNMEIRINDNGTNNVMYTATAVAGVTTIAYARKQYAAGPAGPWVLGGGGNGDFTDLRVRFGSPAAVDANPDQYLTSMMIEAEFPEKSTQRIKIIKQAVNRASRY